MLWFVVVTWGVLSLGVGMLLGRHFRSMKAPEARPEPPEDWHPTVEALAARLDAMASAIDEEVNRLRTAVAEGIEHAERREARINATVRRARKSLADNGILDAGLEVEAAQLQLVDGGLSDPSRMPAVPAAVEEAESSVPGVPRELLSRARGRG